jgi:hypothetical protein
LKEHDPFVRIQETFVSFVYDTHLIYDK